MKSFRILHISDIHCGIFPVWRDIIGHKAMIGACNHALTRKKKQNFQILAELAEKLPDLRPDFIVFTGDLTSIGTSEEFLKGAEMLRPFQKYAGKNFLFIPGNHDRYSGREEWNQTLEETFHTMNLGRWKLKELPILHSTRKAEFVLLDTARPRPWYLSNGYLTEEEWNRLDGILNSQPAKDKPRILLSHFPLYERNKQPLPFRRQLNQWQRIDEYGARGAFQLLLCGHIHHAFVTHHEHYTECCAGSVTIHRQYAVIDFNSENHSFKCSINH